MLKAATLEHPAASGSNCAASDVGRPSNRMTHPEYASNRFSNSRISGAAEWSYVPFRARNGSRFEFADRKRRVDAAR